MPQTIDIPWFWTDEGQRSSYANTRDLQYATERNEVEIGNAGPPVFLMPDMTPAAPNITGGTLTIGGNPGQISPWVVLLAGFVLWLIFRK